MGDLLRAITEQAVQDRATIAEQAEQLAWYKDQRELANEHVQAVEAEAVRLQEALQRVLDMEVLSAQEYDQKYTEHSDWTGEDIIRAALASTSDTSSVSDVLDAAIAERDWELALEHWRQSYARDGVPYPENGPGLTNARQKAVDRYRATLAPREPEE